MSWGNAKIERIQDKYRPHFDAVRRDTTQTPEWHKRQFAGLWLQMIEEVKQARQDATDSGQARIRALTRKAFGVDGMRGDAGSLAISMRDAMDRVSQVNSRNDPHTPAGQRHLLRRRGARTCSGPASVRATRRRAARRFRRHSS